MLITEKSFILSGSNLTSCPFVKKKNGRNCKCTTVTTLSKKKDFPETSKTQQQQKPITVSNTILPRAVVAVLGLGFIDAGYSGDWSRIGVISQESEALLKAAAFVVIPLCIFIIFSFTKETQA